MNRAIRSIVIGLIAGLAALAAVRYTLPKPVALLTSRLQTNTIDPNPLEIVLPKFRIEAQTRERAIDSLARAANVNIVVAWPRFNADDLNPDTVITVPARASATVDEWLARITSHEGIGRSVVVDWRAVDARTIHITSTEWVRRETKIIRVYDVRDLLAEQQAVNFKLNPSWRPPVPSNEDAAWLDPERLAAERLATAIFRPKEDHDDPIMPREGPSIQFFAGRMVVEAPPRVHTEVERVLSGFRNPRR